MEQRAVRPSSRRKVEGTKFDFRLHFHASRVPISGWDKLVVSLLSIETGRITVKTSRGVVRNGSCQWPDPVVESTRLLQSLSTGQCHDKLYKLYVQMGSLRAGILGEATINLGDYITAESPEAVSLPLRNCSFGTVLHVNIQCLTANAGIRDLEGQRSGFLDQECPGSVSEDNSSSSDISENPTSGSVGSSASQNAAALSYVPTSQGHHRNNSVPSSARQNDEPPSFAASQRNSDIVDYSSDKSTSSGMLNYVNAEMPLSGVENHLPHWPYSIAGTDSFNSQESYKVFQPKYQGGGPNFSNRHSVQTEVMNAKLSLAVKDHGVWVAAGLPQKLEVAEVTIQELREETLVWERRARKLMVEVETFKQKLVYESKIGSELKMKTFATEAECDSLKAEVEHLKALKVVPKVWDSIENFSRREMEDSRRIIKELQEQLLCEKELYANLQVRLCKTQDANVDLFTALKEFEGTLEARNKVVEEITEANKKLEEELFHATRKLETSLKFPDDAEVKSTIEVGWKHSSSIMEAIIAEKEQKILWLESQVEQSNSAGQLSTKGKNSKKLESVQESSEDTSGGTLRKPKTKEEEQERDCNNLTIDNTKHLSNLRNGDAEVDLETQFEGGQGKHLVSETGASESSLRNQSSKNQRSIDVLQLQIQELEVKTVIVSDVAHALENEKGVLLQEIEKQSDTRTQLETQVLKLGTEVNKLALDIAARDTSIMSLESHLAEVKTEKVALDEKITNLMEERQILITNLNAEKVCLLEKLDKAHVENNRKTLRLKELVEGMASFRNVLDSHASESNILESKNTELSTIQGELKARISDLEEVNVGLSAKVSSLETQLTITLQDQAQYRHKIEASKEERLDYENQIERLQTRQTFLEQESQEATSKCGLMQDELAALKIQMIQQQQDSESRERTLKLEIDSILDCKKSLEQAVKNVEEALIAAQQDTCTSLDLLQTRLEQLSLIADEKENVASHAMTKVAELQAEKVELENSLGIMEEKVKDLEQFSLMQKALDMKVRVVSMELDASKTVCNDLMQKLQEKESVLQEQLMIQEKQEKEFLRKVGLLEEELLQKAYMLSEMETQQLLCEGGVASKETLDSLDLKDFLELQERLQCLEAMVKVSEECLVICKKDFAQKETELMGKIECLELSNEQLEAGLIDPGAEQLQKELIRLQNQNSFLSRKEQELLSQMHTQEVLQEEVKRLQEANDLLEARLSKFIETAKNPYLLEKIVSLETELAEAVEANNMYKLQLKSVFEKQQLGDIDQVIEDLYKYKKKAMQLQGDFDSMREQYISKSLELAEAVAERGELMITVKNLKSVNKK